MRCHEPAAIAALAAGILALLAGAQGCAGREPDTPTKGQATVAVCEEVLPLIREEEARFEELYPEARVDLRPVTAREAIAALFNSGMAGTDSVKVIVSSRPMNAEETAARGAAKLEVTEFRVAVDALAVIVNVANDVTRLTLPQLDSIFTGKVMDWGLLGWRNSPGRIAVCLPDRNMASYEVFLERVLGAGGAFTAPERTAASSAEMLSAVAGEPAAIGFVGLNWVKDPPAGVRVIELSDPGAPDSLGIAGKYFSPHQAYVYKGFYPIVRNVYIYLTPDSYGVSSGFTSFITSAAGQKIVQNQGLVPATMPVRLVELRNESL
jgi:phosphate transport system substrate-binding protein